MTIVVSNVRQEDEGEYFDLVADVDFESRRRRLRMRRFGNHPDLRNGSPNLDPFAVMLLMPAMIRGEDLVLEGSVDENLLYNLSGVVQNVFRIRWPQWPKIKVSGEPRVSEVGPPVSRGVAAGFSGGVDSMQLFRHCYLDNEVPGNMRLNLLLHHHVGAHCASESRFRESLVHVQDWADRHGLPLVGTICDMEPYYHGTKFINSSIPRNVAAALSLSHLYHTFLYAGAVRLEGDRRGQLRKGTDSLTTMLLPLFDSRQHNMRQIGGEYSRVEKTLQVLNDERLTDDLHVCARPAAKRTQFLNCGTCGKCVKLLVVAEQIGRLDRLKKRYDLDSFRRRRTRCLTNLFYTGLTRRSVSSTETLSWLKQEGYSFPHFLRPAVRALA